MRKFCYPNNTNFSIVVVNLHIQFVTLFVSVICIITDINETAMTKTSLCIIWWGMVVGENEFCVCVRESECTFVCDSWYLLS